MSISNSPISSIFDIIYAMPSEDLEPEQPIPDGKTRLKIASRIVFDINKTKKVSIESYEKLIYLKTVKVFVLKGDLLVPAWMINTVKVAGQELDPSNGQYLNVIKLAEMFFKKNE